MGPMHLTIQHDPDNAGGTLAIVRRHLGWILGPAFAALVLSVIGAYLWPDTFRSTASLRYQSNASDADFERVLDQRTRPMLGRSELKILIDRYDLYPGDLRHIPLEDVIENMKKSIHIGRIEHRDTSRQKIAAFPISFDYRDRFKAQKVVDELLALVVAEKPRPDVTPAASASNTNALDTARTELQAAETKVTEFRTENEGRLPDKAAANQDMMSALRTGLTKVQTDMARVTREQSELQANLMVEQEKRHRVKQSTELPDEEKPANPQLAVLDAQILALEDQIKALKVQYTDNFPDVRQLRQRLDKVKNDRDALAKEDASKVAAAKQRLDAESGRAAAAASSADSEIRRIQTQLDGKAADLDKLSKESLDLDRNLRTMTTKLEGSSVVEKQYSDLVKERDLRKARYEEEDIRVQAARQAATVAAPQSDDSVDVVAHASLPVVPIEPDRALIIGAGSALGLVAGLVMAGAKEANERSLRNLYGIPAQEMTRLRSGPEGRSQWMRWTVALVAGIAAMAISVIHYYTTRV